MPSEYPRFIPHPDFDQAKRNFSFLRHDYGQGIVKNFYPNMSLSFESMKDISAYDLLNKLEDVDRTNVIDFVSFIDRHEKIFVGDYGFAVYATGDVANNVVRSQELRSIDLHILIDAASMDLVNDNIHTSLIERIHDHYMSAPGTVFSAGMERQIVNGKLFFTGHQMKISLPGAAPLAVRMERGFGSFFVLNREMSSGALISLLKPSAVRMTRK